jgi:SAM-dependent MidA family methyltransferase
VSLREKIIREIRERGPIPFSRYMELCLYDPELGYYSRNLEQFGKAGDFYTSSDVHAVFGRLLARQFEEMWRILDRPVRIEILELGPGRGLFARDVLDWSEKKFPDLFRTIHYSLVERSLALRERLHATLSRHFMSGKVSLAEQPDVPTRGLSRALDPDAPLIVFANEFFDALPVEVLSSQGALHISESDGRFVETWVPASEEELEFLERYSVLPEPGERLECPLLVHEYMTRIATAVKRGFVIVIDYGYTQEEQRAGRHRGTLTAYRRHSLSANLYEAPCEQDITAHVNFTALAAAAAATGLCIQPLVTQSQFLLGVGEHNEFADAFEDCTLRQEQAKVALQLKHLITPAGLGETFHVLVGSREVAAEQFAFLSGLSFGKNHLQLR